MDKEKYLSKLKALEEKRMAIVNEMRELKSDYINSTKLAKDFPINSKVIITFPENKKYGWLAETHKGYVRGHILDFENNVRLDLIKLKANGEPYSTCSNGAPLHIRWWRDDYTIEHLK